MLYFPHLISATPHNQASTVTPSLWHLNALPICPWFPICAPLSNSSLVARRLHSCSISCLSASPPLAHHARASGITHVKDASIPSLSKSTMLYECSPLSRLSLRTLADLQGQPARLLCLPLLPCESSFQPQRVLWAPLSQLLLIY